MEDWFTEFCFLCVMTERERDGVLVGVEFEVCLLALSFIRAALDMVHTLIGRYLFCMLTKMGFFSSLYYGNALPYSFCMD